MKKRRVVIDEQKPVWQAVATPARVVQSTLEGHRRPIWWACWTIVWVLVVWDVFLAIDATDGNTWSEVLRASGFRTPVLPWVFGAVLTHLFHHRDDLPSILGKEAGHTVMALVTLGVASSAVVTTTLESWQVAALAIGGAAAAYLLWPKHRQGEWHW